MKIIFIKLRLYQIIKNYIDSPATRHCPTKNCENIDIEYNGKVGESDSTGQNDFSIYRL